MSRAQRMHARLLKASIGLLATFIVIAIVGNASWELGKMLAGDQDKPSGSPPQASFQSSVPPGSFSITGPDAQEIADAQGFLKSLGRGASFEGMGNAVIEGRESALPQGFVSEAFGSEGFSAVMVSANGGVLGFVSPASATATFEKVKDQLKDKGWSCVATGLANQASFIKEEGSYRWMFASCVDVDGGSTLVVALDAAASDSERNSD